MKKAKDSHKENKLSNNLYHKDLMEVALSVGEWALKRGDRKSYRIVIAGYDDEYPALVNAGWKTDGWVANGGYGNRGDGKGKNNKKRNTLFISQYCLEVNNTKKALLFE